MTENTETKGQLIGYARVSSAGQKLEAQLEKLEALGCDKIFKEKFSGTKLEIRDELKRCLDYVRSGDTLLVTRMDRLARSAKDMHSIAGQLEEKGVCLKFLDQDIDTSKPMGKALFGICAVFAELEASSIAERAAQGRKRAHANGVKVGRKPALSKKQKNTIYRDSQKAGANISALARKYDVTRTTIYNAIFDVKLSLGVNPNQKMLFEDETAT
jgi:DNA invertase Pin-like site-specific DNA recombinase